MEIAALLTWVATALGGFWMLGIWLTRRNAGATSRINPGVIFGHFLLAAAGLVIWIVAVFASPASGLRWAALAILVVVALLGFVMLTRWVGGRSQAATPGAPPEQHFPVAAVVGHGVLGATTLVLVLLVVVGLGR